AVRPVYKQFESDMVTGSAEIYKYEMPGGQYSNMKSQVESFGLGHKFRDVKEMYKTVNEMLGDIVKVTPSSKAVGDMAIFMVQNDLTPDNIYEKAANMDFPDSIVSYFEGMMGQPEGGFPEKLQKLVLRDKEPITCRPGTLLEDEDFEWIRKGLQDNFGLEGTEQEVLSYAIYPKVYEDYLIGQKKNGKFRYMGSDIFFHGLSEGETCEVKVREGRELVIRLSDVRETDEEGYRDVIFEVNGNRSAVRIKDQAANISGASTKVVMADEDDPMEIGANIPGSIIKLLVKEGEEVEEAQPVAVIEAMKMETKILATSKGIVDEIFIKAGQQVQAGELVVKLK
ncbi:MAG: pyruvate carboxylase, partial [Eubacteriales bacterium]|nr:pyruvate carboxylase [Eubacteriales bacterium]